MKKIRLKIMMCFLVCITLLGAAACENREDNVQTPDVPSAAESSVDSEEEEEPDIGEHKDYENEAAKCYDSNGIFIVDQDGKKRGMEVFLSGESYAEFYGNELNLLKDRLDPRVNIYSMIVPTACELYCPSNKRGEIDSQEEVVEYIRDILVNVEEVNVLPTLRNHNAEEIYFRTDNRWAPLGAYYAGKVFAKQAGVDYADISEYTKAGGMEYVGNLADYADIQGVEYFEEYPDTFTYYKPKCKYATHYYDDEFEYLTDGALFEEVPDAMYDTFFKGGYYCLKLNTEVKNGRKLIIVKDDFGTALVPFMTSSFEEIYVVDIEYLGANLVEMIEEFKITDVLYVVSTFSVSDDRAYLLETLRTQATHGSLEDNAPDADLNEAGKASSDSEKDSSVESEEESGVEYIYGVGVNNQIGVVENSEPEAAAGEENYDDYSYEEPSGEDVGDGGYDYSYDDVYDDGNDYVYEE